MARKWVYLFKEGDAGMRELLGGKGANLAEMTKIGYRFLRDLPLLPRLVHSTMRMARRSMTRFVSRSTHTSLRWKRLQERSLEIMRIHC